MRLSLPTCGAAEKGRGGEWRGREGHRGVGVGGGRLIGRGRCVGGGRLTGREKGKGDSQGERRGRETHREREVCVGGGRLTGRRR